MPCAVLFYYCICYAGDEARAKWKKRKNRQYGKAEAVPAVKGGAECKKEDGEHCEHCCGKCAKDGTFCPAAKAELQHGKQNRYQKNKDLSFNFEQSEIQHRGSSFLRYLRIYFIIYGQRIQDFQNGVGGDCEKECAVI